MIESIIDNLDNDMNKTLNNYILENKTIKANKNSIDILNNISIDCYENKTKLINLSSITINNNHLIITLFDKSLLKNVEKAIKLSDSDLNPYISNKIIYVAIPIITEERRKKLIKNSKELSEKYKISIRLIRKNFNNKRKKLLESTEISENESKLIEKKIQYLTDKYIKIINDEFYSKEKSLKI